MRDGDRNARSGFPPLLLAAGALALAVRLLVVALVPDVEMDAYGHMNIARAVANEPTNVHVHWVWLPGWHFALAPLVAHGLDHERVRVLLAFVASALPLMLHRYAAPHGPRIALHAALACTIAPLVNVLGVSAQPEIPFALLVLASAWAIDRRRFVVAGALLAIAALVRYEAWSVPVALVAYAAHRLWRGDRAMARGLAIAAIFPSIAIVSWIVLRRATDGEWLRFIGLTREFAASFRARSAYPNWMHTALFPILLPLAAWGFAVPLVLLGIRRAFRPGFVVPLGVLAFLVAMYLGGGGIAHPRYLTALTPFAALAIAFGARILWARAANRFSLAAFSRRAALVMMLASIGVATAGFYARNAWVGAHRGAELRALER